MKYSKKEELRPGKNKEQNMNMVKGTARTRAMYHTWKKYPKFQAWLSRDGCSGNWHIKIPPLWFLVTSYEHTLKEASRDSSVVPDTNQFVSSMQFLLISIPKQTPHPIWFVLLRDGVSLHSLGLGLLHKWDFLNLPPLCLWMWFWSCPALPAPRSILMPFQ